MSTECTGRDTFTRDPQFAHNVFVSPSFFDRLLHMAGRCRRGAGHQCLRRDEGWILKIDGAALFGVDR